MSTKQFIDQMGREVFINYPPRRIISLVPSQTELLFDLGLDEEVVGITKFCIHPHDKFKSTAKIGGTKKLDLQKIRNLKPDLIIGNKEENERIEIEELMNEFPVWMSDIHVLADAIEMINSIGSLTGKHEQAVAISKKILAGFKSLAPGGTMKKTVAYFIWKDPYMVAGQNTFINDILKQGGFHNFTRMERYPEIDTADAGGTKPDIVFLSSEPYPFRNVHVREFENIYPRSKVIVVDGEMFSWYGSRLVHTPSYLRTLTEQIN